MTRKRRYLRTKGGRDTTRTSWAAAPCASTSTRKRSHGETLKINPCSTSKVRPSELSALMQTSCSPHVIASSLNMMELTASRALGTLHKNAKRAYPFWRTCQVCSTIYPCMTREQATRNKTCGPKCSALSTAKGKAGVKTGRRPGKWVTLECAECGVAFERRTAWAKKAAAPMCSRTCNGKARARELRAHENCGKGSTSPEAIAKRAAKMRGASNPAWKGGVTLIHRRGNYPKRERLVRCPPEFAEMARANGYVLEHRLVVAKAIGRPLTPKEAVHHMNHEPMDNRPENLALFKSNRDHKLYEHHGTPAPIWCGSTL